MKCKKCSFELNPQAMFCPQCGEKIAEEKHCQNCGEVLNDEFKFCSSCGCSVAEEKNREQEEIGNKNSASEIIIEDNINNSSLVDTATVLVADDTVQDKKVSRAAAFKLMILLTFIIFFFPICTVSCAGEKITSPNAYEVAYNFGLNQTQMETLDMTIADVASPLMGVVLIVMAVGLIVKGTVAHTAQAIIAFICMLLVKNSTFPA